jgi:hypothetical protein
MKCGCADYTGFVRTVRWTGLAILLVSCGEEDTTERVSGQTACEVSAEPSCRAIVECMEDLSVWPDVGTCEEELLALCGSGQLAGASCDAADFYTCIDEVESWDCERSNAIFADEEEPPQACARLEADQLCPMGFGSPP